MEDSAADRAAGELIETARIAADMTVADAAGRAKIAKQTWTDNARAYRLRNKKPTYFRPLASTIAHMAWAVGVTPGELEEPGKRPDAAKILSRLLADDPPARQAGHATDASRRQPGEAASAVTARSRVPGSSAALPPGEVLKPGLDEAAAAIPHDEPDFEHYMRLIRDHWPPRVVAAMREDRAGPLLPWRQRRAMIDSWSAHNASAAGSQE